MAEISSGEVSEGPPPPEEDRNKRLATEFHEQVRDSAAAEPPAKRSKSTAASSKRHTDSSSAQNPSRSIGYVPQPQRSQQYPLQHSTSGVVPPHAHPIYGVPIHVTESKGKFPKVGSRLGPYFCLGQLGKGTFSSVHKCVNLEYHLKSPKKKPQNLKDPPKATGDTATTKQESVKSEKDGPAVKQEEGSGKSSQITSVDNHSRRRLAAAKVELRSFAQSGVLESEATILHFLHAHLPPQTVPIYMGHYKSSQYAAILMEYLEGEDMNQLREQIIRQSRSRRLHVEDAVYLAADVLLPLLERMHSVGVVHRDVKPSNAVRMTVADEATDPLQRAKFCLVDFGLSKSIVMPHEPPHDSSSTQEDTPRPWPADRPWLKPAKYQGQGFYRKERDKADFRGSSMYASLRVHQLKDYCPRDDVWSVMYVFCDLVSGGLPWMSHAANKERHECGKLKERIQGDENGDEMGLLLMGDEYHVAKHRQEYKIAAAKKQGLPPPQLSPLPTPLPMSKDENLVSCLRKAFRHLGTLQFWETPNYELITECIHGFLKYPENCPQVPKIVWNNVGGTTTDSAAAAADDTVDPSFSPLRHDENSPKSESDGKKSKGNKNKKLPTWDLVSEPRDPAALANSDGFFDQAQEQAIQEKFEEKEQDDFIMGIEDPHSKLPVEWQFACEQMSNHAANIDRVPKHIALRDWFQITLPLVKQEKELWDCQLYEESHRKPGDDGFRRPFYLKLLRQCEEWAELFGHFCHPECFFVTDEEVSGTEEQAKTGNEEGGKTKTEDAGDQQRLADTDGKPPPASVDSVAIDKTQADKNPVKSENAKKATVVGLGLRRRTIATDKPNSDMLLLSRTLVGLKQKIEQERNRRSAPPMRISFGMG